MRSTQAPVAQLDRVVASEAIGRGFESLRARHFLPNKLFIKACFDAPIVVKASFDAPINTNPTDQYPLTSVLFSLRADWVFGG